MKKRVSEIIGFLVIVIAIFSVLTPAVMDPYVKRKYHNYINHTDEHDVVLLGSSLVLNGISPMNMWHDYGITSYNFGNGYSTPAVEYYMLKEILKKHTPKCIVIDTYGIWEYSGLGPVEKLEEVMNCNMHNSIGCQCHLIKYKLLLTCFSLGNIKLNIFGHL